MLPYQVAEFDSAPSDTWREPSLDYSCSFAFVLGCSIVCFLCLCYHKFRSALLVMFCRPSVPSHRSSVPSPGFAACIVTVSTSDIRDQGSNIPCNNDLMSYTWTLQGLFSSSARIGLASFSWPRLQYHSLIRARLKTANFDLVLSTMLDFTGHIHSYTWFLSSFLFLIFFSGVAFLWVPENSFFTCMSFSVVLQVPHELFQA